MALIIHVQFFLFMSDRLLGLNITFSVLYEMTMRFFQCRESCVFLFYQEKCIYLQVIYAVVLIELPVRT